MDQLSQNAFAFTKILDWWDTTGKTWWKTFSGTYWPLIAPYITDDALIAIAGVFAAMNLIVVQFNTVGFSAVVLLVNAMKSVLSDQDLGGG